MSHMSLPYVTFLAHMTKIIELGPTITPPTPMILCDKPFIIFLKLKQSK